MNIPESDLAYEKAGENQEALEELLASLQKSRSDCLMGAVRFLGAVMILGVVAFLLLLYPVFTPKSPHPVMDWVLAHFKNCIIGVGLVFFLLTTGCLLPAVYYDHRIKMLLLLRGIRKARP